MKKVALWFLQIALFDYLIYGTGQLKQVFEIGHVGHNIEKERKNKKESKKEINK